ncbi:MAG: YitT family protein, partial [Coprobacillus sp.]
GATGLSLILGQFVSINYATLVFFINMVMLVIGFFVLGKKFAAGTVLSSFIFPLFLALFESMPQLQNITNDIMLASIYSGIFTGLGVGIVLRLGYSTGGMDVPPIIVNKKTGISVAIAMNVLDTIILLGQVSFSSFEGILYGIITVLITTFVLDRVIIMGGKNLEVLVISKHHEQIAEAIFDEVDRGCTYLNVTTGYFQKEQKAVMSVINTRQYAKVNDIIMGIDPTAFIIASEIHSVKGRGFTLPNVNRDRVG